MVDEIVNKLKLKKNIMKMKLNKWIGIMTGILVLLASLNSCVKNRNELGTDFSQLQDHVLLENGGVQNFTSNNVAFPTDTTTLKISVNLASVNLPTSDVKVTIAVDAAKIAPYNSANGKNYQVLPAAAYKLTTTTLTIPSGQQVASTTISFYAATLDPSVSYLLPISIMDASGKALSSNQNTIYFNVIGNVLAGNYLHSYYRRNGTNDTIAPPNSTIGTNVPIVISPISSSSLLLPEYYLETFLGVGVTLSFDNNSGVLSNFNVSLDEKTQKTISDASFKVNVLKLVSYKIVGDASTKYAGSSFRIYLEVINSGGSLRTMIDNFVKQ